MSSFEPPETGTLVIAALLLLALTLAGYWIDAYVGSAGRPWALLPWFGAGAAVIIVLGLLSVLRRGRGKGERKNGP